MQHNQRRLLPDTLVRQRYHRSAMTLKRWDQNPALKFPKPIVINGRKYRDEAELDFVGTRAGGCVRGAQGGGRAMVEAA